MDLVGGHNLISDSAGELIYSADPSFVDLGDGENSFELLSSTGHYLRSGSPQSAWDITLNHWAPSDPADADYYDFLRPSTPASWVADTALAAFPACGMAGTFGSAGTGLIVAGGLEEPEAVPEAVTPKAAERAVRSDRAVTKAGGNGDFKAAGPALRNQIPKGPVAKTEDRQQRQRANRAELLRQHHEEQAQWRTLKGQVKEPRLAVEATKAFITNHPGSKLLPAALAKLAGMESSGKSQEPLSDFFSDQAAKAFDPHTKQLAKRLSLTSLAKEGQPQAALAGLEDMMVTAPTPQDSLRALVDAMGLSFIHRNNPDVQARLTTVKTGSRRELQQRVVQCARLLSDPALLKASRPQPLPTEFRLYQNYPNPFNPVTEIRFDLPAAVRVELKIYNVLGQEVATLVDDLKAAGAYRLTWDSRSAQGRSVASGMYVYRLKAGNFTDSKKMMLIR